MEQYSVNLVGDCDIGADKENIYINGNLVSGNIYDVLPSLKNSSLKDNVTIKNGLIHIDLNANDSSIREYANNNQDDFYFVEYGKENEWEIEIVNEADKTCVINKIKQSNVKDNILRIPDYIKRNGEKYKVIGNNYNIIGETIEINKIIMPETYESVEWLGEINNLKELYICDGASVTSYSACSYRNLEKIRLPNTLITIGGACFNGCKKLKEINIPESVQQIDQQAFIGSGITEITIPKSVNKLGKLIFQDCGSLKSVIFLNQIAILPEGTFTNSSVESISFPINLEEIDKGSFSSASRIEKIDVPNTVKKIGAYAFSSDNSLKKVRIPNSVNEIGEEIFEIGYDALVNLIIYTDNQIFIEYMANNYPEVTQIRPYNEW